MKRVKNKVGASQLPQIFSQFRVGSNHLYLNVKKYESNSQHNQTEEDDIRFLVDGTHIGPPITSKLLVAHIHFQLNFNNHVASLCTEKISKQFAVISRFRKLLSVQTKLKLHIRLIFYLTAPQCGCTVEKQQLLNLKN